MSAMASDSFYSESFKNQLSINEMHNGYVQKDCKVNFLINQLQQMLHNEKSSPELLPYPAVLIGKITSNINS